MIEVKVVVEGQIDFAVTQRLLAQFGATAILAAPFRGRTQILNKLHGYESASRHEPWFVLMDLDNDQCAPSLITSWLPSAAGQIVVRVAVQEVEAWLLADPSIADTLRVPANLLPSAPDEVPMPKRYLVELVRSHCRTRRVRAEIIPDQGSGAVGAGYSSLLSDFVRNRWNPTRSAERSDSLRRCLRALDELTA